MLARIIQLMNSATAFHVKLWLRDESVGGGVISVDRLGIVVVDGNKEICVPWTAVETCEIELLDD